MSVYIVLMKKYFILGLSKSLSESGQSLNLKSFSTLISESDKSLLPPPPAVAHIDASLIPLPDTEPSTTSSSQSLVSSAGGGGVSGELISKGFPLERSVDPPSLTTYMSSSLSSLTSTTSNVAMTLTGSIGNFSFNSQKLLSPAEFISSPPHSLSTFSKVTPSDFSSALPSVASSTTATTPTSVTVQSALAPPPITSTADSITEVIMESCSNSDDDKDDKVTQQKTMQSAKNSFQDVCETLDVQKPETNLSKMSADVSLSDPVFHTEAIDDDTNKLMTSQHNQISEVGGLSPQQRSEVVQIEGRLSQMSSDFASANDQDSECEEDSAINEANNLVNSESHSKPHPEVQLFPDMLPCVTGQPIIVNSDVQSTNNNLQFLQCNNCSTFNSSDVLKCSHCGGIKNSQWTPQNFLKAIATQNSTDLMIAQSPSTVDAVALNESTRTVESAAAGVVDNKISPASYTAVLTAAPDHARVSIHAAIVTESPRNSSITLDSSSSPQATAVDKETNSIESYLLPSSTSVESNSYSMNDEELTR